MVHNVLGNMNISQLWWCRPTIPALRRWRQEDLELQAGLGYIVRTCFKKLKKKKKEHISLKKSWGKVKYDNIH
jgi:hypothetical protein